MRKRSGAGHYKSDGGGEGWRKNKDIQARKKDNKKQKLGCKKKIETKQHVTSNQR